MDNKKGRRGSVSFTLTLLCVITALIAIRLTELFIYPGSVILPPDFFFAVIIAQLFFLWFYSVKEKDRILWVQKKKEELDEMKSKFTLITSHELMTPITIIKGYLKLLTDGVLGALTGEQAGALEVINKYADRLEAIKDDLTALSSGASKAFEERMKEASLGELIKSVAEDMAPFFNKRRQSVSIEIEKSIPEIMIDRNGIRQVLANLILNAIRFTPDNGRIIIRAKDGNDTVRLEVEDNGIGIPKDKLGKIFESFYEAKDIKKHSSGSIEFKSGGLGIGLAIAKNIIDGHKGAIWAESEVDKFSRFIFTLPKR